MVKVIKNLEEFCEGLDDALEAKGLELVVGDKNSENSIKMANSYSVDYYTIEKIK